MKRFVVNDWIPVFTGMTIKLLRLNCHSRGGGNPDVVPAKAGNQRDKTGFLPSQETLDSCFHRKPWIPASAGMTNIFNNPQNRGFTLIEIIVLIVIAGILLPVIIVPFVTSVKGSGKPEMATKAMYLGHQRMEELMKFQYTDPTLTPTGLTAYAPIPGNSGYEWQWEIVWVDNSLTISVTDVGYKRILARVKDPQNDTYEIYSVVTRFP